MKDSPPFRRPTPAKFVTVLLIALAIFRWWNSEQSVLEESSDRTVRVRYVVDGDTLKTPSGERIRLLGIDTPELARDDRPAEPMAQEAKEWLASQVEGRDVRLRFGPEPTDQYGRTLAWVYLDDRLINRELLRQGYARLYDRMVFPADLESSLREAEAMARTENFGIWE